MAYATRVLRGAIVDGRLEPGERIRQEDIARALGLSRVPVRDALLQLQGEGLVRLSRAQGAVVAPLDPLVFEEVDLMRERLEATALRASAAGLSDDALAQLDRLARELAALPADSEAALALDRQFHLTAIAAAPRARLLRLVSNFWDSTEPYRRAYRPARDDASTTNAEHFLLVEALRTRDGDRAAAILETHIRRARRRLIATMGVRA